MELQLNQKVINHFKLPLDSLLYDPTNFQTYAQTPTRSTLLKSGHAKQGRNQLRLASFSLVCLREGGIPLMMDPHPGNMQDAKAFKLFPDALQERLHCVKDQTKKCNLNL